MLNKVTLIGRLGSDPEVRYMPTGGAVANISLATTRHWKDRNSGERREETEWHRIVFFSKLAEVVGEYLKKGSQVYVEGRIQTNKWQDKEGKDRYTTEIIADQMQMLGSKVEGGKTGDNSSLPAASIETPPSIVTSNDDFDNDIPF